MKTPKKNRVTIYHAMENTSGETKNMTNGGQVYGKRCPKTAVPEHVPRYSQIPKLSQSVTKTMAVTYKPLPQPKYKIPRHQSYASAITKVRQNYVWQHISKGMIRNCNRLQNFGAYSMTHVTNTFNRNKKEPAMSTSLTQSLSVLPTNDDYQQKKFDLPPVASLHQTHTDVFAKSKPESSKNENQLSETSLSQEPRETNYSPQEKNKDFFKCETKQTPFEPLQKELADNKPLSSDMPLSLLNEQPQKEQHYFKVLPVQPTLEKNLQEQLLSAQRSSPLSETRQADIYDLLQDGQTLASTSERTHEPLLSKEKVSSAHLKKNTNDLQENITLSTLKEDQQHKNCSFEEQLDTKLQTEQVNMPFFEQQNGQVDTTLRTGQDIILTADNNSLVGDMMKQTPQSIQINNSSSTSTEIRHEGKLTQIIKTTTQEDKVVYNSSKQDLVLQSPTLDSANEALEKILHTGDVPAEPCKPIIDQVLHTDLPSVTSLPINLTDVALQGIPPFLYCEKHLPDTSLSERTTEVNPSPHENNYFNITGETEQTQLKPLPKELAVNKLLPSDLSVPLLNEQLQNKQHSFIFSPVQSTLEENLSSVQRSSTLSETRQADSSDLIQERKKLVSISERAQKPVLSNQNVTSANLQKDTNDFQGNAPSSTPIEEQQKKPSCFEEQLDTTFQTERVKIPLPEEQYMQDAKPFKREHDNLSSAANNSRTGNKMIYAQPSAQFVQFNTTSSISTEIRITNNSLEIKETKIQESKVAFNTSRKNPVLQLTTKDPPKERQERTLNTVDVSNLPCILTNDKGLHTDLPSVTALAQKHTDRVLKGIPVSLQGQKHQPETSLSEGPTETNPSPKEKNEVIVECKTEHKPLIHLPNELGDDKLLTSDMSVPSLSGNLQRQPHSFTSVPVTSTLEELLSPEHRSTSISPQNTLVASERTINTLDVPDIPCPLTNDQILDTNLLSVTSSPKRPTEVDLQYIPASLQSEQHISETSLSNVRKQTNSSPQNKNDVIDKSGHEQTPLQPLRKELTDNKLLALDMPILKSQSHQFEETQKQLLPEQRSTTLPDPGQADIDGLVPTGEMEQKPLLQAQTE